MIIILFSGQMPSHISLEVKKIFYLQDFPGDSVVKNPPAMQEMQETRVRSLDQEDPTEEGMATHSSILAWKTLWIEEPGGLQSMGLEGVR